ncbi:MAG TPA: ThuA domain-containing protein [Chthoniobacteraceae bacterium]|nr:ThuA domain-containing protein [Chthoniobacteraceae bacterium]
MRFLLVLVSLAASTFALTPEQQQVPLEADSPDPKLAKIVLLAGSVSNKPGQHEYFAGCALMMNWLKATPGVWPVLAAEGWPQNEAVLDGARAIVCYMDGAAKLAFAAPERWAKVQRLVESGAGFVMLHNCVEVPPERADAIESWLGGVWKSDIGCRGHWDMEFAKFPNHPILRGVEPFSAPLDGWLFNLHFAPQGVTPLVAGAVPDKARTTEDAKANAGRDEVIGWAFERPGGGRGFAYTGCDLHRNWSVESQRRLVVNGIIWAAGLEVPEHGAPVPLAPEELTRNFDDKPKPTAAKPAPPSGN